MTHVVTSQQRFIINILRFYLKRQDDIDGFLISMMCDGEKPWKISGGIGASHDIDLCNMKQSKINVQPTA